MIDYVILGWGDLAAASVFLVLNAGLSIWLQLGIERRLALSALRMVVQLLLVGLVLKAVFSIANPWLTALVALVMIGFAAREIRARQERPLAGIWGWSIGGGAMALAGLFITIYGLSVAIRPEPWWQPRYALPLLGMILGNTMTGVSLGLEALTGALKRERVAVEAQLLLGRTRAEAFRPQVRRALRAGFTPIINAMAATGVVSLPGMMTGQILSGVAPEEAVKYQLLIMFLIGGATGLGVLGAVLATARRMSDDRHRLRLDRLGPARPGR
ncbi:MAG TPA: iron export ABC transporter permease subunit FetB [Rhodobacteraceae bacterium]|nr:iron export ABC transporter permease subunit FetB [Paracoccaceae bacterium]